MTIVGIAGIVRQGARAPWGKAHNIMTDKNFVALDNVLVSQTLAHPLTTRESTARTIARMERLTTESIGHPAVQALLDRLGEPTDARDAMHRVFGWVKKNMVFVDDAELAGLMGFGDDKGEKEILIAPWVGLQSGRLVGDCDDFSMLAGSLLLGYGVPIRFVTVSTVPGQDYWSHVYLEAYDGSNWVPIDVSHGEYVGWETEHNRNKTVWREIRPVMVKNYLNLYDGGLMGIGFDWDFFKEVTRTGIQTAGEIFKGIYKPPIYSEQVTPSGRSVEVREGTGERRFTGGIVPPASIGLDSNLLILGLLGIGAILLLRKN